MAKFTKKPLSSSELYQKLVDKNLLVQDGDKSLVYESLERIGYYRLTGFCIPFIQTPPEKPKSFKAGISIHTILATYHFDTGLRGIVSLALQKIEIALAVSICNTLCVKHDARWYAKEDLFTSKDTHDKIFATAAKYIKFDVKNYVGEHNNPNEYLKHYYGKYHEPRLPPAWMLRECASFGFWSHAFKGLKKEHRDSISIHWKYPNRKPIQSVVFESWLHTLTVFRNRCAHHNRITYTTLPYSPKTPDNVPASERFPKLDANGNATTNDLRTFLLIIDLLLRTVAPNYDWKGLLREQFTIAAAAGVVIRDATGFDYDWQNDTFWNDWVPLSTTKA
ncbi:Abi family protein [Duganella fentianensis]|uniref:Abi family protein n=1 Tax=Duganella fentianensis TaxID=2692177 RepID=UPI0032B17A35